MTVPTDRLVTEALAKSGLIWVSSDAGTDPVWYAHLDGVAYFVSGEGEQFSPQHSGDVSVVTRSKETRARLISFDGEATQLKPEDDDWDAATKALKAGRLNAADEDSVDRWREHNRITRITPNLATVVLRGKLLDAPAEAAAETEDDKGEEADEAGKGQSPAAAKPEGPGSAKASSSTPATNKPSPTKAPQPTEPKAKNSNDAEAGDATSERTATPEETPPQVPESTKPKAPPKPSATDRKHDTNDRKADDS